MKWISDRALCQQLVDHSDLKVILPTPELLWNDASFPSTLAKAITTLGDQGKTKVICAFTSQAMLELARSKRHERNVQTAASHLEKNIDWFIERDGKKFEKGVNYDFYIVEPTEISATRAVDWARDSWFTVCLWKLALARLTSDTNRTKRKGSSLIAAVPQKDWSFLATASVISEYGGGARVFIETSHDDRDVVFTLMNSEEKYARKALGLPEAFTHRPDTTTEQGGRKEIPLEPTDQMSGESKAVVLDANQFEAFLEWAKRMDDLQPPMWQHLGAGIGAIDVVKPNLVLFPAMQSLEVARKAVFGRDDNKKSPGFWSRKQEDITRAKLRDADRVCKQGPDSWARAEFRRGLNIQDPWSFVSNGETAWTFLNEFRGEHPGSADLMYTACCREIQEQLTEDNVFAQTKDNRLQNFLNEQRIKNPSTA